MYLIDDMEACFKNIGKKLKNKTDQVSEFFHELAQITR